MMMMVNYKSINEAYSEDMEDFAPCRCTVCYWICCSMSNRCDLYIDTDKPTSVHGAYSIMQNGAF